MSELVARAAQPLTFLVLARLLTPADYGIMAVAQIAISFFQALIQDGITKTILQDRHKSADTANVVFWSYFVIGVLAYLLLYLSSTAIGRFMGHANVALILRLLGLQLFCSCISAVPMALWKRDLDFRKLFLVRLTTGLAPILFSIPFALSGCGVWSLVAGQLGGSLLGVLQTLHGTEWRPSLRCNFTVLRRTWRFALWAAGDSTLGWLYNWGDSAILGARLPATDLGLYRVSMNVITMLKGVSLNPVLAVVLPVFSRLQYDHAELLRTFLGLSRITWSVAFPMGLGLLLVGPQLEVVVFGQKWAGIGMVLGLMGVNYALTWTTGINSELYTGVGRPDLGAKITAIQLIYSLPLMFLAASKGLLWFLSARLVLTVLDSSIHVAVISRLLQIPGAFLWTHGWRIIVAVLLMAAATMSARACIGSVAATSHQHAVLLLQLLGLLLTGAGTYLCVLWYLDKPLLKMILRRRIQIEAVS